MYGRSFLTSVITLCRNEDSTSVYPTLFFFFFEDEAVREMNNRREVEETFPSIDLCSQEDTSTSKHF